MYKRQVIKICVGTQRNSADSFILLSLLAQNTGCFPYPVITAVKTGMQWINKPIDKQTSPGAKLIRDTTDP